MCDLFYSSQTIVYILYMLLLIFLQISTNIWISNEPIKRENEIAKRFVAQNQLFCAESAIFFCISLFYFVAWLYSR